MKLTKQQEEDILPIYHEWWNAYLNGDIKTYDHYFDNEYRFVGSTEAEAFLNRRDTTQFFEATAEQLSGKAEKRNIQLALEYFDGIVFITELADAYVLIGDEWKYYGKFRFSSMMKKNKDGWRFIYQHFSVPDSKAGEGETMGQEQISKENQELKDAIRRNTIELSHKNRELEIEAALERVRARTMGMHHSDELKETAFLLLQQVLGLGVPAFGCGFNIWDDDKKFATAWMAGEDRLQPPFKTSSAEDIFLRIYDAGKRGEPLFVEQQEGEALKTHYEYMNTIPVFKEIADKMASVGQTFPTFQIMHCAFFSHGYLMFITFEPVPNAYDIFKRFARVFEQTYTRFLDLQKAEAQAREAQIEAALEKVRSRTMAMQSSNELQETAAVLFNEFKKLGSENIYQVTIGIYNEEEALIDFRVTSWAGSGEKEDRSFKLSMNEPTVLKPCVSAWKSGKRSVVIDLSGEALEQWLTYRNKMSGVTVSSADTGGRRVITIAFFSKGHLSVSSPVPVSEETINILERFASVFNLTYTRFNDLKIAEANALKAEQDLIAIKEAKQKAEDTLTELKATQKQLVQSEKMASLGELTAGIAHEIQNPLNFVNNFSELSKELADEMKEELGHGNLDAAVEIMNDIIQNLEKINLHGKRADGIVKGMLQHSRSSTGQKEPTDINALCDEYIRLAYHGLRAKDKTFNAAFETSFDPAIGKVDMIPQDMGRVILNLINNAFYAVNERSAKAPEGFVPKVTLATALNNGKLILRVTDNGDGIPESIRDKVFQPFFTTKPTGLGTGLGLSLSYDIIKAHGGDIRVESKEGEGTSFTIELPLV